MLTQQQLDEYVRRRRLSPAAIRVLMGVRASEPSRRVNSGKANVACRFASVKMGKVIQAESHQNELAAVIDWEHDDATHEFYDQPPKIKLSYVPPGRRKLTYLATPDYFLIQEGFTGWVECKTEEWLKSHAQTKAGLYVQDGTGGWRCPPGEEYAAELGLGFRVRSSAETNWVRVRNLDFLADYLDERCPKPDPREVDKIRIHLRTSAWARLKDLMDADPPISVDVLYKLIADYELYVDLDAHLLSEPERTLVFRDRLSASVYRIQTESSKQRPAVTHQSVRITVGERLQWDGQPWRVRNVGAQDVYVEDEAQNLTRINRAVLERMINEGVITGVPCDIITPTQRVENAVRRASPVDFEQALNRYYCLFPEQCDGDVPVASERAIRKWRALYRQAEQLSGSGFIGLLPKTSQRGNRGRKLDAEVIAIMQEVIDGLLATPEQRSIVTCWGEVRKRCESRGLLAPSERAFRDEIRRRRAHNLSVAREGDKASYDLEEFHWHLSRTTPRHGERPFHIGHIDHTELDLHFVGSRRGEPLGKAWLTVLIDAFTRSVLARVIMFDPPSYRSCMLVIRDCVRVHGRIPKYIVVDKGAEFKSTYFETLLAGIESHKKTRPGSKPRFGSIIERLFGITNKAFVHNLVGNNQALQKPRRLSKSHDPRRRAVWTLTEFITAFDGYIENVYSAVEHPALGLTPKDAMAVGLAQAGMRSHMLIPYTQEARIMWLPTTRKQTVRVNPARGVKVNYIYYWTAEFRDPAYAGKEVPVRYDPFDMSVAFVFLKDHWAECRSEYAAEFEGYSEREIAVATQEIRARQKRTGERRAVTARMIAEYLGGVTLTEQSLSKQKRRQQLSMGKDSELAGDVEEEPTNRSDRDDEEDPWGDITPEILGDLV